MPIDVYQIENLFWDNDSYEVPNRIPTQFLDRAEGLTATPSMPNYYGGTIKLTGGHGNGAKYADNWYFLKKIRPLQKHQDIKKQKGLYALVLCMGCNHVLKGDILVKGDIACGNQDELLQENINKCTGLIEKPANIYRIPFKTEKGAPNISFTKLGKFTQYVITTKTGNAGVDELHKLGGFRYATEYLYKGRKDIYIFGFLKPDAYDQGGKQKVANKINDELEAINSSKRSRRVVNVDSPSANNKLINALAYSYADDGIGKINNSLEIKKINLSGCTDIVRVNFKDLQPATPIYPLNLGTGLFLKDVIEDKDNSGNKPGKLARKFYAPFGEKYFYSGSNKNWYTSGGRNDVTGQRIKLDLGNNVSEAFFYGLDRVDFLLSGGKGEEDRIFSIAAGRGPRNFKRGRHDSGVGGSSTALGSGVQKTYPSGTSKENIKRNAAYKYLSGLVNPHYGVVYPTTGGFAVTFDSKQLEEKAATIGKVSSKMIPTWQRGWGNSQYFYNESRAIGSKMPNKTPGYGVLMGQTERDGNYGDRALYTGPHTLKTLYGYSGINRAAFRNRYRARDKGGSRLEEHGTLAELCRNPLVSKFFFDLDWFLGLYFTPRPYYKNLHEYKPYEYTRGYDYFDYGTYELLDTSDTWAYYTFDDATTIKLKTGEKPPFNEGDYPGHAAYRQRQIDKVFYKSILELTELGEDLTINQGDIFASSLEYEGRPGTTEIGVNDPNYYSGLYDGFDVRATNTLEDFTSIPFPFSLAHPQNERNFKSVLEKIKEVGKAIAVCSNYNGDIELREVRQGSFNHKLVNPRDESNQAVKTVDGTREQQIDYGLLKKVSYDIGIISAGDTNLDAKINFLTSFYESLGHKITKVPEGDSKTVAYGDWLKDKDIDDPNGNLFDLVGTNGYVYLRQGKAHFIYKKTNEPNEEEVAPKQEDPRYIDRDGIPEDLKNAELLAKINQINVVYFKTHFAHVKTRFLFATQEGEKDSNLAVHYKAIDTGDKETTEEHYLFTINGDWDVFDGIIHIPKEPAGKRAIGDQIQLEQLRLAQNREVESYELKQQRLGLEQKLINIAAERQEWDLSMESLNRAVNLGFTAAGLAGNLVMRGSNLVTKGLRSQLKDMNLTEGTKEALEHLPAVSAALRSQKRLRKGIRFLGQTGNEGISGSIEGFVENALGYQYNQPERARRIAEDKEIQVEQMAIRSMEMSRAHFAEMQDHALRINNLANQYFKEGVNDSLLFNKGKEEKLKGFKYKTENGTREIDGSKDRAKPFETELYLLTLIPSEEQLKYLRDHRKQFGIHCDIPNAEINLTNGMSENIIQLRNVDEGGIYGITELEARAGLKAKLLNKIKIVEIEGPVPRHDFTERKVRVPIVIYSAEDKARIQDLEGINKDITEKLTEKEQQEVKRLAEIAGLQVQLKAEEAAKEEKKRLLEELDKKFKEKQEELERNKESLTKVQEKLVIVEASLETEKKAVQHNAALVSSLNSQVEEKDNTLKVKQSEIEELRKAVSTKDIDLDRINKELSNRAVNLQRIVNSGRDTLGTIKEEFPEATTYVGDDEADNIATVDTVKNIIATEIQQLKRQKQAYERNIQGLQEKEKALTTKLAEGIVAGGQQLAQIGELQEKIKQLEGKIKEIQDARTPLTWDHRDFLKKFKELNGNIERMYRFIFPKDTTRNKEIDQRNGFGLQESEGPQYLMSFQFIKGFINAYERRIDDNSDEDMYRLTLREAKENNWPNTEDSSHIYELTTYDSSGIDSAARGSKKALLTMFFIITLKRSPNKHKDFEKLKEILRKASYGGNYSKAGINEEYISSGKIPSSVNLPYKLLEHTQDTGKTSNNGQISNGTGSKVWGIAGNMFNDHIGIDLIDRYYCPYDLYDSVSINQIRRSDPDRFTPILMIMRTVWTLFKTNKIKKIEDFWKTPREFLELQKYNDNIVHTNDNGAGNQTNLYLNNFSNSRKVGLGTMFFDLLARKNFRNAGFANESGGRYIGATLSVIYNGAGGGPSFSDDSWREIANALGI